MRGKTALVTGASGGLGAHFASQLAARGSNLVLVARREEALRERGREIDAAFGVGVEVIAMDLGAPEAPQRLYDRVEASGKQIDVLVNNAGSEIWGKFLEIPWESERAVLELDIFTVAHLTKLFAKDMVARDAGFILQIASGFAYQPVPSYATYAAAKAFVLSFGEALSYELRDTGVRVSVLSPGVTDTSFFRASGQYGHLSRYQRATRARPSEVARMGIEAMLAGKPSVVPGRFNAAVALGTRVIPRRLAVASANRIIRAGP